MEQQTTHDETPFGPQQFPLVLVCDGVKSPANIGSIFRLADSFGVSNIYFCGAPAIKSKRMERTSRATHLKIKHQCPPELPPLLEQLQKEQYQLIALEITSNSIPITAHTFDPHQKIALFIGEENLGIQAAILAQVHHTIHIPMYGNNSSMNVAMAAGIALYEITKQWKKLDF